MWDVPNRWNPAAPHEVTFRVDVYSSGGFVASTTDISDGSVTEQWASGVRSRLSLTVEPSPQWLYWLGLPNLELSVHAGQAWGNDSCLCPLGVFPVDPPAMSLPSSQISISAQDRWSLIILDDFAYVQSSYAYVFNPDAGQVSTIPISRAVVAMINQTNLGADVDNRATRLDPLPNVMLQKTRDATIKELVESIGAEVFVDRSGRPVIQDRASQAGAGINDGDGGSLVSISKSADLSGVYNQVGVSTTNSESAFFPVFVEITDPEHPAHYRSVRKRTLRYSSPLLTSEAQARQVAGTLLAKGAAEVSWAVECFPDPARMPGDVVPVTSADWGTVSGVVTEVTHSLSGKNQTFKLGAA